MLPKSSVVITTYNREKQLDRCLYSILEWGSHRPEEIVVVDDGPSGDNTSEVVRSWADRSDVQISYIPNPRPRGWRNPARPRNIGIRFTDPRSEIIVFSEPEMLWSRDALARMLDFMSNRPEYLEPEQPWLPKPKTPQRFFVLAAQIGYINGPEIQEMWKNPDILFGCDFVNRRYPEMNTRLAACWRSDVFAVRGWDERFVEWGYDDSDFINRMVMYGSSVIPLKIPVIHLWHENPPANIDSANRQHQAILQLNNSLGDYAPNPPDWGTFPPGEKFPDRISKEVWDKIQADELLSWTDKAWPSRAGKLKREKKYLQDSFNDLGLSEFGGVCVDVGCGPYSILELMENTQSRTAFDPLHEGYQTLRQGMDCKANYAFGTGENIPVQSGSVDLVTSINGIDHYERPLDALREIKRILKPGGVAALSFCINNASQGHPHPAHRIDLDNAQLESWAVGLGLQVVRSTTSVYGWRHQPAAIIVLRK